MVIRGTHVVGAALLYVALAAAMLQGKGERFKMPFGLPVDKDGRILAHLNWMTTDWDPKADEPFKAIQAEMDANRVFPGFDHSGTWARKARGAYWDWLDDCQNCVKLFRVSSYLSLLRTIDRRAYERADVVEMRRDVQFGWYVVRKVPKSYLFVRQGYNWHAGCGMRHRWGDMCEKLLAKDPLDRLSLMSGIRELSDQPPLRLPNGHLVIEQGRGQVFEDMLLKSATRIRATKYWRPWDNERLGLLYFCRAQRTLKAVDLDKAIEYGTNAAANCPEQIAKDEILDNVKAWKKLRRWLKG